MNTILQQLQQKGYHTHHTTNKSGLNKIHITNPSNPNKQCHIFYNETTHTLIQMTNHQPPNSTRPHKPHKH